MHSSPVGPRTSTGRRTSDAFLRRALEIAHLGWWNVEVRSTTDFTQNVVTWSDEVYRIFGHEPKSFEPNADRYFAQIPADDHPAVIAAIRRAFDEGVAFEIEHRIIRPDGSVHLVEQRAAVEWDANGAPVRMIGTVEDVSDRRRIENALSGRDGGANLVSQIVEHSRDAILSVALDGVVTTWNAAAERVFGYKASEVIGRDGRILVPPGHEVEAVECIKDAIRGTPRGTYETVRLHRDGSLINVEVSTSPIIDSSTGGAIGASAIIRDITQQRRMGAQLQHAQRLESVGRLAGGVAHDFNNLLMAITGYAELLRMDLPEDATAQEDLRAILASAERGARLTRQLLAFGRRQVLRPVHLDLNVVLREIEGVLRPLAGGDVTLRLELSHTPAVVRADRAQVEQIVVNLVANARDAMPHGGVLEVSVAIVDVGGDGVVHHGTVDRGPYVRMTVSDTGIGMDAEVQSRLFEPFFTTKPHGTSTGMGLATTYGIVKQSGGFITVESVLDRGTAVRAFLPLVAAPAGMPADTPANDTNVQLSPTSKAALDPRNLPGGDETVLIVEDDSAVRASTRAMLERLGYRVFDTASPAEALELLDRHREIRLVVTDVLLPEMTGMQLGEIVRAGHPQVSVIRMSGYAGDGAMAGIVGAFLQKPVSIETLAAAVRSALTPGAASM